MDINSVAVSEFLEALPRRTYDADVKTMRLHKPDLPFEKEQRIRHTEHVDKTLSTTWMAREHSRRSLI
jgi:hypothetical protein